MPPANDNWASATVITGASGSRTGLDTNAGATAQAGEPANAGKTVWYKWTAPFPNAPVFFATWRSTEAAPQLTTILQVFTGAAVNALTEVTYITGAAWKSRYADWDLGSMVAFNAISGTDYYIRVDGVGGATGNFPLVWDQYFSLLLSACNACHPFPNLGYSCKGTIQIDTTHITSGIDTDQTVAFGNMPAGRYIVSYCGGAFAYDFLGHWSVSTHNVQGPHYEVIYKVAGVDTTAQLDNYPVTVDYVSQPDAEIGFACLSKQVDHDGGNLSLRFYDQPANDNTAGSPNPIFGLYLVTPTIKVRDACANWTVRSTSASCLFRFDNFNDIDWDNITATLSTAGGISSPSAPQTGVTVGANGFRGLTFTFNASTPNVTATLTLTSPYFPAPIVLNYFLGPIITFTSLGGSVGSGACGGHTILNLPLAYRNDGFFKEPQTIRVTATNGVTMVASTAICAPSGTINYAAADANCSGGTSSITILVVATGASTATVFTVEAFEGATSLGSHSFNAVVP